MTRHWKGWLDHTPHLRGHLTAYDFDAPLRVRFETGTVMDFDSGFYARERDAEDREMVVVYTEHHGYYVYPWAGVAHIEGRDATEYVDAIRAEGPASDRAEAQSRWFAMDRGPQTAEGEGAAPSV